MEIETLQHKEEIKRELNRVLTHSLFKGARRSSSFLRYICEKTLAGESHQIKEFSIAVDAFGLEMTFDQQIDPRIRVEAKRLRDRLNQYYEGPGCQDSVIIQMEKGSYIPSFCIPESPTETDGTKPEKKSQSVLLDKRFLIHFDLPEPSIDLHDGTDFFISQLIHELFLQGQIDSGDLPLSEILQAQKTAFSLILTVEHYLVSDSIHFILRLQLKDNKTLIYSHKTSVPISDLEDEETVKRIVQTESQELLKFCRSVRS